jgi:DNA-binding response OmpR family regulator
MPKIMVADDDITMVSLLRTLLSMEGYQVIAPDINENIPTAVQRDKPDVLLLDVYLPSANGLDILDQLRSRTETKTLPVVMASGLNLREECLEHGANDFLLKPYMPDDLLRILKNQVSSSQQ